MNAFMSIVSVIQAVANLLPAVIAIVQQVENALPASGQGAAKLSIVKGVLQNAWEVEQKAEVSFDRVWPTIQSVISTLVAAYNSSGLFKKS